MMSALKEIKPSPMTGRDTRGTFGVGREDPNVQQHPLVQNQ